ncbi:PQQ-dependent sugar dehydrogenase [Blastococcus capsensis]|uniref:PQQ-dependent sugar dehydrogenase n=1 Tax=Blastococcus capsensis TaxID=1564163 RepID=UPI00253F86FA|nr:PQQ-dependent sugar dehydrogenase [Blastococcus capsensis]MDK3258781.1 PQQ-dependent sugar dehydrogenase [Blastococcus capsensis]
MSAVAAATLALAACGDAGPATSGSPSRPGPAAGGTEGQDAAAPAPLADPAVALQSIADGLTSPVAMAEAPDGSGRLFVVDQIGLVRVITPEGELLDDPFLDIRDQVVPLDESYDERGLLGLAFHPEYAENGRFFVYYSAPLRPGAPQEWNNTSHLSEYRVTSDPLLADPASERVLMRIDEPQANHAGGTVAFGPDGYLYLSLGDGGGAGDVGVGHPIPGNGQDPGTILGSILRIDVDSGDPYGIPEDNPFATGSGEEEVYAYGFRNPYRFSFDLEGENRLFVGDAGQNLFEEVSIVERGGNYGWRIKEGTHCFDVDNADQVEENCADVGPDGRPLIPPVIEYSHDEVGLVVVGGYVYRGEAMPELEGVYVFGDWSETYERPSGTILAAVPAEGDGLWPWEPVRIASSPDGELGRFLQGFGQDADGEMYVLVKDRAGPVGDTGEVLKLVPPDGSS